jgi:hypothetical protein
MTRTESLIDLFERNGGQLTLLQLKQNWELIGSNETGRISDARKHLIPKGKTIKLIYKDTEHPSRNTYAIVQPGFLI